MAVPDFRLGVAKDSVRGRDSCYVAKLLRRVAAVSFVCLPAVRLAGAPPGFIRRSRQTGGGRKVAMSFTACAGRHFGGRVVVNKSERVVR